MINKKKIINDQQKEVHFVDSVYASYVLGLPITFY